MCNSSTIEQTGIGDIEKATKAFADAHAELSKTVTRMERVIERYKRKKIAKLKRDVANAAEKKNHLHSLIDGAPTLFLKPRTYVFHGFKVGLQKGKGGIEITDPEKTVELIKKHFKDRSDTLIHVEETPIKDALETLTADDLKKIGCGIKGADDFVVIKSVDSEVEKIVNAFLKDATSVEAK